MKFRDIIKKSVLEGFSYSDFTTTKILVTLGITLLIAVFIFMVYRRVYRNSFYNKGFNVSMSIIAVVTAGVVMSMQSNLVISLGMVGALSIIRFRTAIKEPMDLLFLFWSISIGIICGASLYEMAILLSLVVTAGIFLLQKIPVVSSPLLLIVKLSDVKIEEEVLKLVKEHAMSYKIDSKSISNGNESLIVEVRTKKPGELVNEIAALQSVTAATIMQHDGEVKF